MHSGRRAIHLATYAGPESQDPQVIDTGWIRDRVSAISCHSTGIYVEVYRFDKPQDVHSLLWELAPEIEYGTWLDMDNQVRGRLRATFSAREFLWKLSWSDDLDLVVGLARAETWDDLRRWWIKSGRRISPRDLGDRWRGRPASRQPHPNLKHPYFWTPDGRRRSNVAGEHE